MPKVSVIIPCYNQGRYIDEAVDSVLAQSFGDFEIIIINDGSTDKETNRILADYSRPKTRVIRTDNQGLAAARNNGIREARGEYILPLDADDRIGETYLEQAVRLLERNPDFGIVYCRAQLFGAAESEWVLPAFSLDEMLLDNVIFCSSMFRRQDWDAVGGYDTAMVYGWEDYDFWLSLIERGCLVYKIPEILFYYRVTADSMVRSKKKEQKVETFEKIFQKHRELYLSNIRIWIDKIVESRETYYTTQLYIDAGDGFNECHALTQKLDPRTMSITFDLSTVKCVKRLRFDPVDDYCVLHLGSVRLTSSTGRQIELDKFQANTQGQNRANLVFSDNDPHLIFDLAALGLDSVRLNSLSITLEFLAVGQEAFFYLLNRKNEQLEIINRELSQQKELLERKDDEIARLRWFAMDRSFFPQVFVLLQFMYKRTRFNLRRCRYRLNREYRLVRRSGLFDADYYFSENSDLLSSFVDPLAHYLEHGQYEGRNPNPLFNGNWYWLNCPEIEDTGESPLAHYIEKGWRQGQTPSPMFETSYYLAANPDVEKSGENPLLHYLRKGAWEGRNPNPVFDSAYYLAQNSEVRESGENPLVHYMNRGFREGRLTHAETTTFQDHPKISIITPVYNVAEPYLRACIESVLNQVYENWELCLVDDAGSKSHVRAVLDEYQNLDERIKVRLLLENQGIAGATNEGAALASGEYIGFLDHDDELTRDALLETVRAINEHEADIIYSDECFIDSAGVFQDAHHKPDFSPDLLLCHNYITHFLVVRKELFEQAGKLSSECDGAQDYDLALRLTELSDRIVHIPRVLYRWRTLETSTSADPGSKSYADGAGKLALEKALARRHIDGEVYYGNLPFYYRVKRTIHKKPLVSIMIPFCDQPDYLRRCIDAIRDRTSYRNYEVIGISNNSRQDETMALMAGMAKEDSRIRFLEYNHPFNYAAINNFAAGEARGEHLVLMNNDIEVLNADWLEALLEHSQRPETGAVGAKLYYPDETIQHAGVIVGIGGFAGHSHRRVPRQAHGYFNRLFCVQNVSAVTGALFMVKKKLYDDVGGMDAENLAIALNDVDFCLKLRDRGYLNVFTPYCEARHYESVSRGYEDTPEKKERFDQEVAFFRKRWASVLAAGDPYYNPNLTLEREDFSRNQYQTWYSSEESRQRHLGRRPA